MTCLDFFLGYLFTEIFTVWGISFITSPPSASTVCGPTAYIEIINHCCCCCAAVSVAHHPGELPFPLTEFVSASVESYLYENRTEEAFQCTGKFSHLPFNLAKLIVYPGKDGWKWPLSLSV